MASFKRNLKFGLTVESTYNTFVRPGANKGIAILEASVTPNQQWMEDMQANAIPEKKLTDVVAGVRSWTAKVRCKVPREGFGQLLKNLFGSIADAAIGAPFTGTKHTFSASSLTPASVSLLLMDDVGEWQLSGGVVKMAKFIWEINKPIYAEIDFIGGGFTYTTLGTAPTIPTTSGINPFYHFNDGWLITAAGVSYTPDKIELTIETNYADGLADSYEINTTGAASNARKQLERAGEPPISYRVSFHRLLQNTTQAAKFLAGTTGATSMESGNEAGTGATDYFIKMSMANCLVKNYQQEDSNGVLTETVEVEGYQSASTDNQFIYKDKQTVS